MFQDKISDISADMAVLSMDKILYDSGFHTAESDIDSDYEYEIFSDALFSMDGYAEEDEDSDCCIYTFYTDCIKEYVSLALKYGRLCGITQHQNFWIPKIRIDFDSPDGNIYFILAAAVNASKAYNLFDAKEQITALKTDFNNAQNYEDALDIIRKYVDIIED